jgi:hypothetical protein
LGWLAASLFGYLLMGNGFVLRLALGGPIAAILITGVLRFIAGRRSSPG